MAKREVTHTGKDEDGDITKLCYPGEWWSPRMKVDAISDIELNLYTYYVKVGVKEVQIHVVNDPERGKYLRTNPDETEKNNLDELPDC